MKASTYASKLRNTQVEKEIAKELRLLDETDAFQFVIEMLDVHEFVGLDLAQKCLRTKDYFVKLLLLGLERGNAGNMDVWLRCVTGRIGIRRVLSELEQLVDTHTVGISKMLYFLPRLVDDNDEQSKRSLGEIQRHVSAFEPGLGIRK